MLLEQVPGQVVEREYEAKCQKRAQRQIRPCVHLKREMFGAYASTHVNDSTRNLRQIARILVYSHGRYFELECVRYIEQKRGD